MAEPFVADLAGRLGAVPGVVGVVLGGSRARGAHTAASDHDLGVYYRPPLDTIALRTLARAVAGADADVTEPGEWGPWVDGGAWLRIGDAAVDWIYRDVDRVNASWRDAVAGRYAFHAQYGHPLGVPDFAYAGELALGVVLHDPSGALTALHDAAQEYPPALAAALVDGLHEADFLLAGARKSLPRADPVWLAACLARVVLLCVHALHGRDGRWLIHEKGALASAARLTATPPGFVAAAERVTGRIGRTPDELAATVAAATELVASVR